MLNSQSNEYSNKIRKQIFRGVWEVEAAERDVESVEESLQYLLTDACPRELADTSNRLKHVRSYYVDDTRTTTELRKSKIYRSPLVVYDDLNIQSFMSTMRQVEEYAAKRAAGLEKYHAAVKALDMVARVLGDMEVSMADTRTFSEEV